MRKGQLSFAVLIERSVKEGVLTSAQHMVRLRGKERRSLPGEREMKR